VSIKNSATALAIGSHGDFLAIRRASAAAPAAAAPKHYIFVWEKVASYIVVQDARR
jgi:hypothetical protein